MTTEILLFTLQGRLRLVRQRIEECQADQQRDHLLYNAGALRELGSEESFLLGLVAQLEREGVRDDTGQ